MKKLGTPIGDGPGSEKLGVPAPGTPVPEGSGVNDGLLLGLPPGRPGVFVVLRWDLDPERCGAEEGLWPWLLADGVAVVDALVVVLDVVVLDEEDDVVEEEGAADDVDDVTGAGAAADVEDEIGAGAGAEDEVELEVVELDVVLELDEEVLDVDEDDEVEELVVDVARLAAAHVSLTRVGFATGSPIWSTGSPGVMSTL